MNSLNRIAYCLLALAGGLVLFPGRPQPNGKQPGPLPSIEIATTDPGDVQAIKFLGLYAQGNAKALHQFAARVRANSQTNEWAGVGPAATEWRQITQEVLKSSQEGLARKILQMQDDEVGWEKGGQELEAIANGWDESAAVLSQLAQQRSTR